jgi:hypothetical protein
MLITQAIAIQANDPVLSIEEIRMTIVQRSLKHCIVQLNVPEHFINIVDISQVADFI